MKTLHLITLLLLMAGCTAPPATLTSEQARTLARELANEKAKALYACEPFRNGPAPRFAQGRWVWRDRRGHGPVDIEATVEFGADGSNRSVEVLLLDSRARLF